MIIEKIDAALSLIEDSKTIIDSLIKNTSKYDLIKENIAVIDDDRSQLRIIKSALSSFYNIRSYRNTSKVNFKNVDIVFIGDCDSNCDSCQQKICLDDIRTENNNIKIIAMKEHRFGADYYIDDINKEAITQVLSKISTQTQMMNNTQQKKSILYVDDEQSNLLAFKAYFRIDFDVHISRGMEEAFRILESNHIDIVLADQRMPNTTGVEFLEKVFIEYPDIRRILTTAYSDVEAIIDSINKSKISNYVKKPWDLDELNKILLDE